MGEINSEGRSWFEVSAMVDVILNFLQAGDWTALDPQYLWIQIMIGLGVLIIFCHLIAIFFDQ